MAAPDTLQTREPSDGRDGPEEVYGLLAEFGSVDGLIHGVERLRRSGYSAFEAYSPFPVHGLDAAMGTPPTRLPWLVLAMGAAGAMAGLLLVWYTNAVDYPFLISGKPRFSLQANIPVIFETAVLLSAFGAVFGMLILNRLPQLYHPLLKSDRFRRATDDRFFIAIEATDPAFDRERTTDLLRSIGASSVEEVTR